MGPTTRPYVVKLLVVQTLYLACDAARAFTLRQTMQNQRAVSRLTREWTISFRPNWWPGRGRKGYALVNPVNPSDTW